MTAVNRTTILSPCRTYRFALWREWDASNPRYAMFVGLNPSTADEATDDATIRRCIAFAKAWRYGALCMTNLFAYRATVPSDMKRAADPVGPENDRHLLEHAAGAGVIVAAWGIDGKFMGRDRQVKAMLPPMHYLRLTKGGHPGHPLYLPADLIPTPFVERASQKAQQEGR
jgi:hypothetical protein